MSSNNSNVFIPEVYAANSNVGCVREHNEDSFVASSPLFVVADGMGGHEAGEVASEIAVNTMVACAPQEPDGDGLVDAVKAANLAVIEAAANGTGKPGMGTTMTAAQVFGDKLFVAQVGDSRAYLLHDGQLQRVTRDHSLVADLVEQGRITEEEARFHPRRSVITRALGSDPSTEPDLYVLRVEEGDRLLLCSDGLCGMVYDETIASVLASAPTPYDACENLIKEALAAGGSDNVTAVVVDPLKPDTQSRKAKKKEGKRRLAPVIWALVFILVIVGAVAGFTMFKNNSYYVGVDEDDHVCLYQGLPGEFLGLTFSEELIPTDIDASKLANYEDLKERGVTVDSEKKGEELLDVYALQIERQSAKGTSHAGESTKKSSKGTSSKSKSTTKDGDSEKDDQSTGGAQ